MGVPAFFRWLVQKFPRVLGDAVEEGCGGDEVQPLPESSAPNPNKIEFDNLYLG
jgi:5'-3' exonuclease